MQSEGLIFILVTVVSMFGYAMAQCQPKQPMENYVHYLVEGKFYLVAIENGFSYQDKEARCGISYIKDADQQIFNNLISYQDSNGNPESFILTMENTFPPGSYNVSGGDGTKFQAVVLGALQDKVHIYYGCNPQNNRVAVWVYYSARVQGLRRMDAESRRYVKRTLANNNIPLNDLHNIDNYNCNNDS